MERSVLVTGASGFIGRHLVTRLLSLGNHVRVLVRTADAAQDLATLGAEPLIVDLLVATDLADAVAGIRTVYHLAGRLFAPDVPTQTYKRLHVDATIALLEACRHAALDRFLLCTTTGVLGPTGPTPAREDDEARPQNAYEETKALSEQSARQIATEQRLPLVIARPGLVYGPGDLHLLGLFRAIRGGYYRVIGTGTNHVHPIFIDDLVDGLLLAATRGRPDGRAYNLVGPHAVTMRELSDAVGSALGCKVSRRHLPVHIALAAGAILEALPVPRASLPLTRSRVRFMTQERVYDGTRARVDLGFDPEVDLDAGLAATVRWYRDRKLLR